MKEIKVMDETNSDGKVLKDAVVQTTWTKTGKDADGNEGVFSGATPLTAANVSESDFKALNTLTEEQVLTWIKALVEPDAVYVAHINEQILKDIERSKITQKAMPWGDPDFIPPTLE
tara:strand:- start:610 stop:960 length:351 start_codon:yes stop_codon:yes gene_type:complete